MGSSFLGGGNTMGLGHIRSHESRAQLTLGYQAHLIPWGKGMGKSSAADAAHHTSQAHWTAVEQ